MNTWNELKMDVPIYSVGDKRANANRAFTLSMTLGWAMVIYIMILINLLLWLPISIYLAIDFIV